MWYSAKAYTGKRNALLPVLEKTCKLSSSAKLMFVVVGQAGTNISKKYGQVLIK